jgi:hypothetical protein
MEKKKAVISKEYEKPAVLPVDKVKAKITPGDPSGFKYCGRRAPNKADTVQQNKE